MRLKIAKLNQQIEHCKEERRANMYERQINLKGDKFLIHLCRNAFEEEMGQLRQKFLSGWKDTVSRAMTLNKGVHSIHFWPLKKGYKRHNG